MGRLFGRGPPALRRFTLFRFTARQGNDVMRLRTSRIIQRGLDAGGMAALLLAIGALGGGAAGQQQGATPPPQKVLSGPARKKDEAPKADDSKAPPVKL